MTECEGPQGQHEELALLLCKRAQLASPCVTSKPVHIVSKPVCTTSKSVCIASKPVRLTSKPVRITGKPAGLDACEN